MAIRITEDGTVIYENEPDVERELFPNTPLSGVTPEQITQAVNTWLEEHPEATTTVEDGSITKTKLDSNLQTELDSMDSEIGELQELAETRAVAIYETASGSIASFSDGADDMPMKSCVVNIEPIQEGSGDPSPDNVRPISGRTGLTVFHSGADTNDPTTISVNWETEAGSVYGGTLDVISGKLTVDSAYFEPTSDNIYTQESWELGRFGIIPTVRPIDLRYQADPIGLYCNRLKPRPRTELIQGHLMGIAYDTGVRRLQFYLTDTTTYDEAKQWVTDNPLQIVYKILNPFEIQLTPQEISTLLGENSIWSDGGNVEVEYPADTKMYIQKLTGSDEDDMVANTNIPDSTYFLINNTLYKSTAAIASGDTIVPGTNCTVTNIAEALNALNTTT